LQHEENEALESANLVDMDSTELDEVGEEAIAQMIASDPEMAALFGMDADGGSVAKSLSDTPSLLESQTVSEEELAQMFGDDTAAIADWKQFTDAGVSLPPFGNDNTQALEGRELLHEGYFPFLPCSEGQWCSLDTLGPLIFGADKWATIWTDALSKALAGAESTLNNPRRQLISLGNSQMFTCKFIGELLKRPTQFSCNLPCCLAEIKGDGLHKVKGQKVLICPEHSKSKSAGMTTYRVLRIFPALYSLLQSVMVKTGKNLFDGLPLWRVLLPRFEVLFQAAAVTLIRARNWVAGKLMLDPPYEIVRKKKELKQQSVKALMLSSPASACNATGNTAGSIGSKGVASKTSGKAPMSALPLKPAVPLTLEPPAPTKEFGGKGTGKGKQNQKPAGKGKKRNAPAAAGDKASPVKTGKSAKSSKQSAKSDKAQYALQLIEKGFTREQITAMLRN
jgi:hypothetical protein